jgi:hypothetical protein
MYYAYLDLEPYWWKTPSQKVSQRLRQAFHNQYLREQARYANMALERPKMCLISIGCYRIVDEIQ